MDEKIAEVELNQANGWSHVWEDLNKEFIYHVEEANIPDGYKTALQLAEVNVDIDEVNPYNEIEKLC